MFQNIDKHQIIKNAISEELKTFKRKHQNKIKILKCAMNELSEEYLNELTEEKEYIHELNIAYNTIDSLVILLSDVNNGYTDFEKVLVNID